MRSHRLFSVLRRHKAGVGRLVLVWFALAAATASAAPCVAMSFASDAPAAHHDGAHADANHHAHAVAHDHASHEAPADPSPASPCPHCPLAGAMAGSAVAGSHSLCAAGDDVADGGKAGVSVPSLKYVPAAVTVAPLPIDAGPSPASQHQRLRGAATSAIALNLRYCVFLI